MRERNRELIEWSTRVSYSVLEPGLYESEESNRSFRHTKIIWKILWHVVVRIEIEHETDVRVSVERTSVANRAHAPNNTVQVRIMTHGQRHKRRHMHTSDSPSPPNSVCIQQSCYEECPRLVRVAFEVASSTLDVALPNSFLALEMRSTHLPARLLRSLFSIWELS